MLGLTKFIYCPRCGSKNIIVSSEKSMQCKDCNFIYFHNVATAVGALIEKDHKILLCERAREPQKGMLDLPGGFVDYHESLEAALKREIKEELNLEVNDFHYFGSASNQYEYRNVTYITTDVFFIVTIDDFSSLKVGDDVSQCFFFDQKKINLEKIAFPTCREMVKKYIFSV